MLSQKNEILLVAAIWMDLEDSMLSEICQRQVLYDVTYTWNLKTTTNEVAQTVKNLPAT